jgi:Rrf2 family protein
VALLELAALPFGERWMQAGEIARRQGIPERYLEQMLITLRRGELLRSLRGPRGGYQLTRPANAINLAEVITCLEGRRHPPAESACSSTERSADFAAVEQLEQRLQQAQQRILQQTTLAQLLEERQLLQVPQPMFFI